MRKLQKIKESKKNPEKKSKNPKKKFKKSKKCKKKLKKSIKKALKIQKMSKMVKKSKNLKISQKITSFKKNRKFQNKFLMPKKKYAILLVLPNEEVSHRPEVSSPPRFRIQGGGTLSVKKEEGQRTKDKVQRTEILVS